MSNVYYDWISIFKPNIKSIIYSNVENWLVLNSRNYVHVNMLFISTRKQGHLCWMLHTISHIYKLQNSMVTNPTQKNLLQYVFLWETKSISYHGYRRYHNYTKETSSLLGEVRKEERRCMFCKGAWIWRQHWW